MAKDVIITPANGTVDFLDATGNTDGIIQLDDSGNLKITNPGGDLSIGDVTSDLYIGDGINSVDIIFEQNGAIRGLTGKTLTLGQSDSSIAVAAPVTSAQNITISKSLPKLILDSPNSGDSWTAQGAQISLGESGDGGSAALHMTYVGNGYGYLGMGTIPSTGIPPYSTIRFLYNANQIYINSDVGIGTPSPTSTLHVTGNANITNTLTTTMMAYREFAITNTAVTGANTINLRSANWFDCTLTGNATFTFNNAPASGNVFQFTVITRQNATGGRTVSWSNTVYWAGGQVPPTTTAANGRDIWSFVTIDGGSTYFGTLSIKDAR